MGGTFELHSFSSKFCNLWSSGRNVCLAVECQAGKTILNFQLDHPKPQEHHQKRVGPSRLRHRSRWAQTHNEGAVDAAQTTAAEDEAGSFCFNNSIICQFKNSKSILLNLIIFFNIQTSLKFCQVF